MASLSFPHTSPNTLTYIMGTCPFPLLLRRDLGNPRTAQIRKETGTLHSRRSTLYGRYVAVGYPIPLSCVFLCDVAGIVTQRA